MELEQELEWLEAQKIQINEDLISSAKQQLELLAAVDRQRWLYDGPGLDRAIHRYKACWLPLLAKHTQGATPTDPLVVPLDCEWIWHCHRLNPVQYQKDCKRFYGKILDNKNVQSSLGQISKHYTVGIWAELYPEEPFELDNNSFLDISSDKCCRDAESITYDLISAVKRQSSFYYQVAGPNMQDDHFLEGAVARYKGFLYLIKRNQEESLKCFCVPTYDVDLMWHSHQLQPLSYSKDMKNLLGRVLEHDDTDSDRTKGKKLDTGFSGTTKQWEDTFGLRYWRAGAMYRGSPPTPLTIIPELSNYDTKSIVKSGGFPKFLSVPQTMVVEVMLEIVRIRNFPSNQKSNLFVLFSKKEPDMFFSGSCRLNILSESGAKQVAGFKCEPTGDLVLTLMSRSTSNMDTSRPAKAIGSTSISLKELINPDSKLSIEKWFELKDSSNMENGPISLHVATSFTVPVPAPHVLHMVKSDYLSGNACFFPLPRKVQHNRRWIRFMDDNGNEIISLQMRYLKKAEERNNTRIKREVVGVTALSRKPRLLAEYAENLWSLKEPNFSLHLKNKTDNRDDIFELIGNKQLKLFPGRKLEYELKNSNKQSDGNFITVVKFSTDNPYGKAAALLDLNAGLLEVNEESFVLTGILLAFILSDMFKKEGYKVFIPNGEKFKEITNSNVETDATNLMRTASKAAGAAVTNETNNLAAPVKSGGCGSGCGGRCATLVTGGGCAGSCGGGCGKAVKSAAGCGAGCGGGCGNVMVAENKGGGCSSGCGNGILVGNETGGCGGGCGSGCGTVLLAGNKTGGCGGGCGSGCANVILADNKTGGCGGGCGNGIVGDNKSGGGCAGGCAGGCGNGIVGDSKSGGCSGGCGGGCRNGRVADNKSCGCGSGCGSCGAEASPNGGNMTTSNAVAVGA